MKMKDERKLFVQNLNKKDVLLSDLGIKVRANSTINVYAAKPKLTEDEVNKSLNSGSLFKRLESKTLRIVNKPKSQKPKTLDLINAAKTTNRATKTKSSVIIDTSTSIDEEAAEQFDFADYGVSEIAAPKKVNNSTFVVAKEDPKTDELKGLTPKPQTEQGPRQLHGQILMKVKDDEFYHPNQDLVPSVAPGKNFVVSDPKSNIPKALKEENFQDAFKNSKPGQNFVVAGHTKNDQPRSIKTVKLLQEEEQQNMTPEEFDALQKTEADQKIKDEAQKNDPIPAKQDGIVVMEQKSIEMQVGSEEEAKPETKEIIKKTKKKKEK